MFRRLGGLRPRTATLRRSPFVLLVLMSLPQRDFSGVYETRVWMVALDKMQDGRYHMAWHTKDGFEAYHGVGEFNGTHLNYWYEGVSCGRASLKLQGDELVGEVTISPSRRVSP